MDTDDCKAKWIVEDAPGKPNDWPRWNLRELKVDLVWQAIRDYYNNPNPITRDVMLSHAFAYDLDDLPSTGRYRICEHEAELLNRIYRAGECFDSWILRLFAYHVIVEWIRADRYLATRNRKLPIPSMVVTVSKNRKDHLASPLRLFYRIYTSFYDDWSHRTFSYWTLHTCTEFLNQTLDDDQLFEIEHAVVGMLFDLSGATGTRRDEAFRISRAELQSLLKLEAEIFHRRGQKIMKRPLKGTLMIQLSNFILKSRNGYSCGTTYKHMSSTNINAAYRNGEVWIRDVRDLNDKHEGELADEIIAELGNREVPWARDLPQDYHKEFYVACYSRSADTSALDDRYGECVLGYNGDRLVDFLGPIYFHTEELNYPNGTIRESYPMFSQVAVLDVIYDRKAAIDELRYLASCIAILSASEDERRAFLAEILQYWKLSFKDAVNRDDPKIRWEDEKERRYVIFYYPDSYHYLNTRIGQDRELKFKSTIIYAPDFIIGNSLREKDYIQNLAERFRHTSLVSYCQCAKCGARHIMKDRHIPICTACGSTNLIPHIVNLWDPSPGT